MGISVPKAVIASLEWMTELMGKGEDNQERALQPHASSGVAKQQSFAACVGLKQPGTDNNISEE